MVAHGELERAADVLESFESLAERLDAPHALATAARCRGLLDVSEISIGRSTGTTVRSPSTRTHSIPFELEELLAVGRTRRRARQKSAARAVLVDALDVFAELGATLWVARVEEELARIPGRRTSDGELTRMETQVLELAAEGRSNKEIAAALHVSVHTVEAHLTRIYRKVGVRSRSELIARGTRRTGAKT